MNNRDRLGFIGKEKDYESNLGDFGVRKYESFSGRFTSIDALWEKYYSWSPYHYSGNNLVIYLDPKGLNWFTNKTGDHGNIKAYNNFMKHLYKLSSNPIGLKINYYLLSK